MIPFTAFPTDLVEQGARANVVHRAALVEQVQGEEYVTDDVSIPLILSPSTPEEAMSTYATAKGMSARNKAEEVYRDQIIQQCAAYLLGFACTLHQAASYHALMHDVVTLGHEWAATQNLYDILDARPYTCDADEAFSAQLLERSHALAAHIAEQATTAMLRAAEQNA